MSTPNSYKNFIAATADIAFLDTLGNSAEFTKDELEANLEEHTIADPTAGQWRTIGLIKSGEGYCHELDGAGYVLNVGFNDRNLPAAVINEKLVERMLDVEKRQGYKVGRKQIAELKDEVVNELLPKAFIKRSTVPVIITRAFNRTLILVFTGSPKKFDDTMAFMNQVFAGWESYRPAIMQVNNSITDNLNRIAREQDSDYFQVADAATLKGADKRTVRIKNAEIDSGEFQALLNDTTYDVQELSLFQINDDGDLTCAFSVNDALIFKRVVIPDTSIDTHCRGDEAELDLHAYSYLVARVYSDLVTRFVNEELGGLVVPKSDEPTSNPTDENDDEL